MPRRERKEGRDFCNGGKTVSRTKAKGDPLNAAIFFYLTKLTVKDTIKKNSFSKFKQYYSPI